jgi:glycosyltransferase involved in cell wall biosynthesis
MKLAILIPVYNAEKYLGECLASVRAAGEAFLRAPTRDGEPRAFGVFCCDDGSTDGSLAFLQDYAATLRDAENPFADFRVTMQKNAGVVATRNRLMDELPGDYDAFAFMDADDFIKPEMYARLAEALERTGADVAECEWDGAERVIDDMSVYCLRRTSPGRWINVINKIYRRAAVGAIRFRTGLAFEEDFFFNSEVNAAIKRKALVPGFYYAYRSNPDSATNVLDLRKYFDSTSRRVKLSLDVFLKAGRVPKALEPAWRAELSKDAYRMCIRKNLKRNRDAALRWQLFCEAGAFLTRLENDYGFRPTGLNSIQSLLWRATQRENFVLARLLAAVT